MIFLKGLINHPGIRIELFVTRVKVKHCETFFLFDKMLNILTLTASTKRFYTQKLLVYLHSFSRSWFTCMSFYRSNTESNLFTILVEIPTSDNRHKKSRLTTGDPKIYLKYLLCSRVQVFGDTS